MELQRELILRNEISDIFLTVPDDEMYGEVLQAVIKAMESKYGIFGYIDEQETLVIPSMTRDIWSECQVPQKSIVYPRDKWGGIWGRALKERKILYANEDLHVPAGHIPVEKVICAPILYRGKLIGLLEIANRVTDYGEEDRDFLENITNKIAPILNARLERDRENKRRKDAEEALQSSKEWFSTTLRSIGDGVITTDEKAFVTLMNPVAQALTGWSEKDAIGKPLKDVFNIFNEETGKQAEVPIDRIIREGMVVGLANHTLLIAKDGTRRSIDDSGAPIRDDKGNIIGTILVFRDVTEKRQLERDLTERVKELTCLYAIAELVERPGITLDEIYQETVNLLPQSWQYPDVACARITVDGREHRAANYRETEWTQSADIKVYGVKAGSVEVSYLGKKPVRYEGPFLREERSLINAVAERLGRITERIRSENQLQRVNHMLFAIRNVNQLIVREKDTGKLLQGTCDNFVDSRYCYHAWSILLDSTKRIHTYAQAGLGQDFSSIVSQAWTVSLPACCQKALKQDEVVVVEDPRSTCVDCALSHRCANGVGLAANLKYGDKTYGFLCVCTPPEILSNTQELALFREVGGDLSLALRNLELEAERTKTDRIKDEFISLVSHELRTPLTVVMGSLQTAISEGVSPDEARELLENAAQGADSLAAILENMLELSRHQAGRLDLRSESVSISDVAESVIKRLKDRGAVQRFSMDFPGDLPMVEADLLRVERILYNLLQNATKYSPEETEIRVFARKEDDFVVTGVADQGTGISPEHHDKLFELFYRLETPLHPTGGVGLGLVVCKRLVEAQGGWIKVDSDLGRGSTFLFALPLFNTTS